MSQVSNSISIVGNREITVNSQMPEYLNCQASPMLKFVVTGGPAAGKTTVLDILRELGYAIGKDSARSIIRQRKTVELSPGPGPK